jgi:mannosidase alpha-like ER degradation enhancer 3
MDSFVLAETFKYLYLLFDSLPHRFMDIDQFIFTTEAHLLPMNIELFNINETLREEFLVKTLFSAHLYEQKNLFLTEKFNEKRAKNNQCPAMDEEFQSHQYKEQLRRNIRGDQDMTETITTISAMETEKRTKNESNQRVTASDFSAGDPEHVSQLTQMGIQIQTMTDGRKKTNYFFLLRSMRI